jgi:DNA-binding transcriptional LysR family regulator
MNYTLRQLEVFLAVARTESVSRAGRELALSQSAVSGALADLERAFDVALFDRVGKRLRLSDVGRSVRSRAEALWDEAAEFEAVITQQAGAARLKIGATLTIGNYVVVPIMARFMRDEPGSVVTLDVANTETIARRVSNFELDVGLVEGELSDPELDVTPFRDDELVVFCSPSDPLASREVLTDDDLKGARWIVREHGSGTRQAFERAMIGVLPQLPLALELQHTEAIKKAVEAGLGVGCLSRIALEADFRQGTLRECKVPHRDFRRKFYFVMHRQKHVSPAIQRWLGLCRDAA